jgi:hypothetical protein
MSYSIFYHFSFVFYLFPFAAPHPCSTPTSLFLSLSPCFIFSLGLPKRESKIQAPLLWMVEIPSSSNFMHSFFPVKGERCFRFQILQGRLVLSLPQPRPLYLSHPYIYILYFLFSNPTSILIYIYIIFFVLQPHLHTHFKLSYFLPWFLKIIFRVELFLLDFIVFWGFAMMFLAKI